MIRHGTVIPVGEGATSRVCKAFDETSGRWIAIKYLLHADPATRLRLLREARAVSVLDHPHLCPILEVGEQDGRPCIVMPFLDGASLADCAGELSLEARVRVLAQVADGVHHAHERRLLHRDLKPENIVITREAGLPHAWVLDFGLVRDIAGPGITATGEVLGTPAYMSPEQARGEDTLDRRSDVFALGAVLYFALAGKAPFTGSSTAQTLMQVMQDDPPSLRRQQRDLPAALEAIVAMALEKTPRRRYDSARAFGDDLRRFLAGTPPLARQRWSDRLRRSYRRRPLAFVATAVLAISAIGVALLGLHWSARSSEQARLAGEAATAAEEARQALRLEYLRPQHDVTAALAHARDTIARLMASLPDLALAQQRANLLAAAQLQLDMDDIGSALAALRRADALGSDTRASSALGLALVRAYRAALAEPQPFSDPAVRARIRERAEREFLQPARERLSKQDTAAGFDWQTAAELRFANNETAEAIAALEDGAAREPAHYEALLAAAEMRMADGVAHHWSNDFAAAGTVFAQADALLARALDDGRSDPRVHRRRCELASLRMDALSASGDSTPNEPDTACVAALQVRPDDAALHRIRAHVFSGEAKRMRSRGDDADPTLRAAIASAERALELAPDDGRAAQVLALALMRRSTQQRWTGSADLDAIERAEQVLADADGTDAGLLDFGMVRGMVQTERAQVLEHLGRDPSAAYERAIASLRTVVERLPEAAFMRLNLANVMSSYQFWLSLQGRPDPQLVQAAIAELERVLQDDPERATAWSALANSHWDLAMAQRWRGLDTSMTIAEADRLYAGASARDPGNLTILFNRYMFDLFVAAEAMHENENPEARLSEAGTLMRSMDERADDWITPCPRAEYSLRRLQQGTSAGRLDPALRSAVMTLIAEGLQRQPDDHDCSRRRVELATMSLPLLPASEARAEFDIARAAAARHPDSREMDLALLALLGAAASLPGLPDATLAAQREELHRALEQATSGAWSARLDRLAPATAGDVRLQSPTDP